MSGQSDRTVQNRLETATGDERSDLLDGLALAAAAGDPVAAETLAWAVRRLGLARPSIRRYLLRPHDVETAEQLTLIAVALRIGSFRGESRFTTWLYRVAGNEAKQFVRREHRHVGADLDEVDESHDAEQFVARVSSMIADELAVRSAIAAMPDRHRRPLLLREESGLSYAEIADELGVPLSTAKTWVRRGRAELASALGELYGATRRRSSEA